MERQAFRHTHFASRHQLHQHTIANLHQYPMLLNQPLLGIATLDLSELERKSYDDVRELGEHHGLTRADARAPQEWKILPPTTL